MKDSSRHNKAYRDRYPERRLAHSVVNNAIRRGRLSRLPCESCGRAPAHAHHDDYSKPLDVRWLCHVCHEAAHHGPREDRPRKTEGGARRLLRLARKAESQALLAARALRLRDLCRQGMSYAEAGAVVGVSKSQAFKIVNRPDYK